MHLLRKTYSNLFPTRNVIEKKTLSTRMKAFCSENYNPLVSVLCNNARLTINNLKTWWICSPSRSKQLSKAFITQAGNNLIIWQNLRENLRSGYLSIDWGEGNEMDRDGVEQIVWFVKVS